MLGVTAIDLITKVKAKTIIMEVVAIVGIGGVNIFLLEGI
jgi:hypothetical protein